MGRPSSGPHAPQAATWDRGQSISPGQESREPASDVGQGWTEIAVADGVKAVILEGSRKQFEPSQRLLRAIAVRHDRSQRTLLALWPSSSTPVSQASLAIEGLDHPFRISLGNVSKHYFQRSRPAIDNDAIEAPDVANPGVSEGAG